MNTPTSERRDKLVFFFVFTSALLAIILALTLLGLEAYIRWAVNKDFAFLGGSELGVLIASASALVLGTGYLYRSKN